MKVSNGRLCIIGQMIGIYREEKKANSHNCWTQKRFCQDICSPNTLKNIEKGGIARSIDVYKELLHKLDLKLGEFLNIEKAVLSLIEKLYRAIEFYKRDGVIAIIRKELRILEQVNQYTFYNELYDIFSCLLNYYENDKLISFDKMNHYKRIMYLMPKELNDIYRFMIYAKLKAIGISSKNELQQNIRDISLEKSKANFMKIVLLDYYYIAGKYLKMKSLLHELEKVFTREHNTIRLFDIYDYTIVLFSRIEFEKSLEYVQKAERMVDSSDFPKIKVGEFYSNTARAFHINGEYGMALKYYNKMREIGYLDYIDSYIFMADSQNRLDLKIEIPIVKGEQYERFPDDVKFMYKYFTFGDEYPDFAKESFILKKITPTLSDDEYIEVFRFELLRLVNKTNHYKRIHSFELMIKENTASK